ncbi:DPH3 homolog isoform X2 [Osmerus eperlanus]|uniref:DPH3 homolog isoform X2 n=1 Tax=Osmerus eperlanus TaxID=29151 RepID=UPI002E1219FF
MSVFHDEVEIEDFEYDEDTETYYFPCPCGDKFAITKLRPCKWNISKGRFRKWGRCSNLSKLFAHCESHL